jgi:hypothetical protein
VIRWKNGVLEYEADEKHRAVIMKELGLEDESNSVVSPIVKVDGRDDHDEGDDHDDEPLSREEQRQFRALAARANYLAQDRPDLQYAVKEVCRSMAKPTVKGVEALKRIGRYLVGVPTLTWHFVEGVETPEAIDVFADSDWAGCRVSRRSTSGGVASVGGCGFKSWSSTQASVALSSGEAEYFSVVKAAAEGLGIQAIARDLGWDLRVRLWVDSSAAKAISSRRGLGKIRHLDVRFLWLQERVACRDLEIRKIAGVVNPADVLTKPKSQREMASLLHAVGVSMCEQPKASRVQNVVIRR